jgi:hypothetical protein
LMARHHWKRLSSFRSFMSTLIVATEQGQTGSIIACPQRNPSMARLRAVDVVSEKTIGQAHVNLISCQDLAMLGMYQLVDDRCSHHSHHLPIRLISRLEITVVAFDGHRLRIQSLAPSNTSIT